MALNVDYIKQLVKYIKENYPEMEFLYKKEKSHDEIIKLSKLYNSFMFAISDYYIYLNKYNILPSDLHINERFTEVESSDYFYLIEIFLQENELVISRIIE